MDQDEQARIEKEDDYVALIVRLPAMADDCKGINQYAVPLGIVWSAIPLSPSAKAKASYLRILRSTVPPVSCTDNGRFCDSILAGR
jgi:hypothetical protein